TRHPRGSVLKGWRKTVRSGFEFSVMVPASLAALDAGAAADDLLAHARGVSEALGATWWLLRTPTTVTPNPRSMRALEALVKSLRTDTQRVAWEPRGIWNDESALF